MAVWRARRNLRSRIKHKPLEPFTGALIEKEADNQSSTWRTFPVTF
jgi:hypothetical protein